MKITEFKISDDNTKLNLTVTDAASVISLRLWKDTNYKDFSKAIDLSSKLTGSSTEVIVITLSDINEFYFDGVYFIEAEDEDELSLNYTYKLTSFKKCILNKLNNIVDIDCLIEDNDDLINAHSMLLGLEISLQNGYINEIIEYPKVLRKFCGDECKTCGETTIVDNNTEDSSTINDIIINLDGGNR